MGGIVPTYAFTTKSNGGLMNQLTNQVAISQNEKSISVTAVWDTGASGTCISAEVVNNLSLIPTGKKNIHTAGGIRQVNTYLVDIILPNNVSVSGVEVCDTEIGNQGIGILIGMDIITKGDFSVSNYNNTTVFSFRIPSRKRTDYVQEVNKENLAGTHGTGKRKRKSKKNRK